MHWPFHRHHSDDDPEAAAAELEREEQAAARQRLIELARQHSGRPEKPHRNDRWTEMDRRR